MKPVRAFCILLSLFMMTLFLAGCNSSDNVVASMSAVDPVRQAAAEATAILQSARATALVLQAQKEAQALIVSAEASPEPAVITVTTVPAPMIAAIEPASSTAIPAILQAGETVIPVTPIASIGQVDLLGVSFAADGGFLMVSFIAPPTEVAQWYQGTVSMIDEATGTVYNEIPIIPVVGPMVGRPIEPGQRGYVMLVNAPVRLQAGALVTVQLGEYRFEHIPVQ